MSARYTLLKSLAASGGPTAEEAVTRERKPSPSSIFGALLVKLSLMRTPWEAVRQEKEG